MKRLRIKQYPRRYRYKFPHIYRRLNNKSLNSSSTSVTIQNGFYYVKILEPCRIQFYLIRSLFNLLRRATKGSVELWFYGCFFLPLTGKPLMRMGTGKGKWRFWVAEYRRGDIIMEFSFVHSLVLQRYLFKSIICKLPMRIQILRRHFL